MLEWEIRNTMHHITRLPYYNQANNSTVFLFGKEFDVNNINMNIYGDYLIFSYCEGNVFPPANLCKVCKVSIKKHKKMILNLIFQNQF